MVKIVRDLVMQYHMKNKTETDLRWPIVTYADGPTFVKLKSVLSPTHSLPMDFLKNEVRSLAKMKQIFLLMGKNKRTTQIFSRTV